MGNDTLTENYPLAVNITNSNDFGVTMADVRIFVVCSSKTCPIADFVQEHPVGPIFYLH